MRTCSIDGCASKSFAKSYCVKHYKRNYRYGDPLALAPRPTLEERFEANVNKTGSCWLWQGTLNIGGYGQICKGGRHGETLVAHRLAYECSNGPIPDGLVLDHICRVRKCVNPEHLRAVTQKQNMENQSQDGRPDNKHSGVRGVYWDKKRSKWATGVRHNGRSYYAGTFSNIEDAKAAVIAKRNELYTHNDTDRIPA